MGSSYNYIQSGFDVQVYSALAMTTETCVPRGGNRMCGTTTHEVLTPFLRTTATTYGATAKLVPPSS